MTSYEQYRVENVPAAAYYIPDFITEEEEEALMQKIYAAPRPKWKELSRRRLQNWGGLPHPKGMVAEKIPVWLQAQMERIVNLGAFGNKLPNHVLVNEYLPGQGIMPHVDGPMFYPTITTISIGSHTMLDLYTPLPLDQEDIKTSNQEENKILNKYEDDKSLSDQVGSTLFSDRHIGSLLLEPRSLLILKDDLYTSYLHGIAEVSEDEVSEKIFNRRSRKLGDVLTRATRISLTIRHVPKVLKAQLLLGKSR